MTVSSRHPLYRSSIDHRDVAQRRVGILGGMGPAATVDFYGKLVAETPAERDQDHLPVVIWADPRVPDRTDGLMGLGEDPTPWLEQGIQALVAAGCGLLAVPCNTAHAFVPGLASRAGIELVSIVDVAADVILLGGFRTVGILATTGTLTSNLYTKTLAARGVQVIEPGVDEQKQLMEIIRAIKANSAHTGKSQILSSISTGLVARGADVIVAACTELVLTLHRSDVVVPVIDPARELARRIVKMTRPTAASREGRGREG